MGNNTWEPSLPFGRPRETPTDDAADATGLPWETTPGTSHVAGFRFYDARKHGFIRKFGSGESQLHVRFRSKTGAITSEYWYFFADHDQGAAYFGKLKSAAHPGHVVQELIAASIPYKQQGKF